MKVTPTLKTSFFLHCLIVFNLMAAMLLNISKMVGVKFWNFD